MSLIAVSAPYIIVHSKKILHDHSLIIADEKIADHCPNSELAIKYPDIEIQQHKESILCAGFVNAHSHLELSFIPRIKRCDSFFDWVFALNQARTEVPEQLQLEKNKALISETIKNGTIAFGDITNSGSLISYLNQQKIRHHSFIEILGFNSEYADKIWADLNSKFADELLAENVSLSPHALYSLSDKLLRRLAKTNKLMSIHLDELPSEKEFLNSATGEIRDFLNTINVWDKNWQTPQDSPQNLLTKLGFQPRMLRVHNLQSTDAEVLAHKDRSFILCPRSNYYLHNKLPNFKLFEKEAIPFALATDSLASNDDLSILNEMKFTFKNSELSTKTIFAAGAETPANFLNFSELGSLEIGKAAVCNSYRFAVLSADPIKQILSDDTLEHKLLKL